MLDHLQAVNAWAKLQYLLASLIVMGELLNSEHRRGDGGRRYGLQEYDELNMQERAKPDIASREGMWYDKIRKLTK